MIYQDPYSSLNRLMSVGAAIVEPARFHGLVERRDGQVARCHFARDVASGRAQGALPGAA